MALNKIISEGIKDSEVKLADMADDSVGVTELSATGTASSSTFLRGDNAWATPTDTNTTYTAGTGLTLSSTEFSITDDSIAEVKLDISNTASDGQFLQYKDSSDKLTWATVDATPEGTAIKSTGESGGTKFLREDGDNSCSWQSVPAGTPTGGNSGANKIFWENEQTVTHDYTITNNHNAGTWGPVTINSSVTVTIGDGEYWTIM